MLSCEADVTLCCIGACHFAENNVFRKHASQWHRAMLANGIATLLTCA